MSDSKPYGINPAEAERTVFCHILGRGTDWWEAFDPSYWEHTAFKFRDGDRVEVHTADRRTQFELVILSVNHRSSPPLLELGARPIWPLDLVFPQPPADRDATRFRVRAMRGSTQRYEIFDAAKDIVISDNMPRDQALDLAAAKELEAQAQPAPITRKSSARAEAVQ